MAGPKWMPGARKTYHVASEHHAGRSIAGVPFVGEEMKVATSSENKVAPFLPITFHHVASLVEPRLLHDLLRKRM